MDDEPNHMRNPYGYIQAVIDRHVDVTGLYEYRVTEVPCEFHGRITGGSYLGKLNMVIQVDPDKSRHLHIHGLLIFNSYEDCAVFLMEDACYKAEHPDAVS